MQHWNLSLPERVMLLKLWILPLVIYPARVIFPTQPVVPALRTIYTMALKNNSWGITPNIVPLAGEKGGFSLAQPRTILYWQHATPFVQCAKSPGTFPLSQ